jgi:SAM-dependent methyltransferase
MKCYSCNNKLQGSKVRATRKDIRFECYSYKKYIIECRNCGLTQLVPQWTKKELDVIYKDYSQKKDFPNQKVPSKRLSKYLEKYFEYYYRILEVGCSTGDNVKYFNKRKGYIVTGIDKDSSVEDTSNSILNYDVYDKFLDDYKFNAIYGLHILEHMQDPIKFINRLLSLLEEKGKIILEFPNLEEPLLTVYKVKEFDKFYWRPDHLFFYTPETLASLIYRDKVTNCVIERKQNYGIVNHLNWLIRKNPTNLKINIPILDSIYKWILINIVKKTDTMLLVITKEKNE